MSSSSLIGRKLGKYEIVELVGQGGMATVYKGYQDDIDRHVAVKVLPPHPGLDRQFIERFRLEARTVARLQHPHILPLYDYGVQDDILYLVTAYIEGGSLNERINRGRLPPEAIAHLLRQIAGALDYAHRHGIIHRDIKPDNILLDREGNALLADFGIAKLAEGEARLTVTGGLVGTPAYMSPEQGRGETVSGLADIYSLGVVVYELLTGAQPYTASTPMQVVLKHMTEPVPSLRAADANLPPALEVVMQRVLSKDPASRYQTAAAFADDFSRAIQGAPVSPPQPAPNAPGQASSLPTLAASPTPPPAVQYPTPPPTVVVQDRGTSPLVLLGGFGVIAALLVAVVFLVLYGGRPAGDPPPPPTDRPAPPTAEAVTVQTAPVVGRLSYASTNAPGDTLRLSADKLKPPPPGRVYAAWLLNTVTGETQLLGELTVDALGYGVLPPFIDPDGRPLFALFNAVAITDEPRMAETAAGPVVYSAVHPPELLDALTAILIESPDGFPRDGATGSLLDGALTEASTAAQHAALAAASRNIGGMHTHAEHTINILLGTEVDYDGNGRGENPGRGVGVPHFLDLIEAQLDMVADAPTADRTLQSELEFIRVCAENTRVRVDELVALEQALLAASDVAAAAADAAQSLVVAEELLRGADLNANDVVEPFEGECGLAQIITFGVLVSNMNLVEGGLPE